MLLYITGNNCARVSLHCRVLQKAQQEADNSEEPAFVDRLNDAIRNLRGSEYGQLKQSMCNTASTFVDFMPHFLVLIHFKAL